MWPGVILPTAPYEPENPVFFPAAQFYCGFTVNWEGASLTLTAASQCSLSPSCLFGCSWRGGKGKNISMLCNWSPLLVNYTSRQCTNVLTSNLWQLMLFLFQRSSTVHCRDSLKLRNMMICVTQFHLNPNWELLCWNIQWNIGYGLCSGEPYSSAAWRQGNTGRFVDTNS